VAHSQTALRIRPPAEPLDCGIPLDSQYFDDSRFDNLPSIGGTVVLARVELPAQYCGVLEYFSQYTDAWAHDNSAVETPGLVWQILANRQPLSPYHQMSTILNPWGFGSFQFTLRLPEGAVVEMVVRHFGNAGTVTRVGGRLLGRYWYNSAYGGTR
jgi:hypothetical protein